MRRPPSTTKVSFDCPHCGAFAHQVWYECKVNVLHGSASNEAHLPAPGLDDQGKPAAEDARAVGVALISEARPNTPDRNVTGVVNRVYMTRCMSCRQGALWVANAVVWPSLPEAEPPSEDMPPDIRLDYIEASTILAKSPRGAAALLRLAVQKLVNSILKKESKIDAGIQELVDKGMPQRIQQALDYLRVIGNEAVHPGQIDLRDDRETAERLFGVLNLIVEQMISFGNRIDALYGTLPPNKLEGIENRDRQAKAKAGGAAGG